MLKKVLKYACIGFLIGVVAGNVIALMTGGSTDGSFIHVSDQLRDMVGGSLTAAVILQCLLSGVYGALCFAGSVFYDIERWPLALATGAHCALIVLIYIPLGFFLGWLSGWPDMLIVAGCQIVTFFIIWLIMWAIYKKQVKELNEMQELFQRHNNKTKEGNHDENH